MKPEEKAREKIDQLLLAAGWQVQDHKDLNLGASLGVAVREFPVSTGYADYMLFVDRKAAGVIEAKPAGTTLTSAEHQSEKYLCSLPPGLPCFQNPLPYACESTGVETFFRDLKDPSASSRRLFAFHTPETLCAWASDAASLRGEPSVLAAEIIENLEAALEQFRGVLDGLKIQATLARVWGEDQPEPVTFGDQPAAREAQNRAIRPKGMPPHTARGTEKGFKTRVNESLALRAGAHTEAGAGPASHGCAGGRPTK